MTMVNSGLKGFNVNPALERSRPPLCSGLERNMYLKRKILTSSQMVKMAEIFCWEVI